MGEVVTSGQDLPEGLSPVIGSSVADHFLRDTRCRAQALHNATGWLVIQRVFHPSYSCLLLLPVLVGCATYPNPAEHICKRERRNLATSRVIQQCPLWPSQTSKTLCSADHRWDKTLMAGCARNSGFVVPVAG